MSLNTTHLRELGKAATAGPWDAVQQWNHPDRAFVVHHQTNMKHADVFATGSSLSFGGHAREADADFVAAARNHWFAMLDEIDRLRSEVEQVQKAARLYNTYDGLDLAIAAVALKTRVEQLEYELAALKRQPPPAWMEREEGT